MRQTMLEKKEEGLQQVLTKASEVGIDEVGRGAIFGPVFSAVVVLTKKNKWINKKDLANAIKFYGKCEYSNYLKKISL